MNETRNRNILIHIDQYCDQIAESIDIFGNDYDIFCSSNTYRNACCMCLLQIGELAGTLSNDFISEHTIIPWKQIKGFRNIVAHAYGTVEPSIVWDILSNDIPVLKNFCKSFLE